MGHSGIYDLHVWATHTEQLGIMEGLQDGKDPFMSIHEHGIVYEWLVSCVVAAFDLT